VETVEGVDATARTLTLPARRWRRRMARGGEVQSATSLRRSAILEAIAPLAQSAAAAAKLLLLLLLLVTEIGMWVVVVVVATGKERERNKRRAVRGEMGGVVSTRASDLHLKSGFSRGEPHHGCCEREMPLGTGARIFMSLSTVGITDSPPPCHFTFQ
jgi:hypothetical protein